MYLFGKYSTYFGPPNLRIFFCTYLNKICTYFEKFCTFVLIFAEMIKFCLNFQHKRENLKKFSPAALFLKSL